MACAAIGGSHLVSSTQAGALYGYQLAILIVLANVFKYPFFRFGPYYTLSTGRSLIEGYALKGRPYLIGFGVLNLLSGPISAAAVLILTAALLQYFIPVQLSITVLCLIVLGVCLAILLFGHYSMLDKVSKLIMLSLTTATVLATIIAFNNGPVAPASFQGPSPWTLSALAFLVPMVGWMPAPIEVSALTSMWLIEKQKIAPVSVKNGLFDCNVGYWSTAILALFFLALGALVQYGSDVSLQLAGGPFVNQLISMYATTIGEWSRLLVAFIAFATMFSTTITVLDGYGRSINETMRLIRRQQPDERSPKTLTFWMLFVAVTSIVIILYFQSKVPAMLAFAMIMAFLTAPVFAWLNFSLVRDGSHTGEKLPLWLTVLSWVGFVFLTGFALLFLWWYFLYTAG